MRWSNHYQTVLFPQQTATGRVFEGELKICKAVRWSLGGAMIAGCSVQTLLQGSQVGFGLKFKLHSSQVVCPDTELPLPRPDLLLISTKVHMS